MQVPGVFIDISIKDSTVEGKLDFDQLSRFELVETAGTSLPYVCFQFFTFNHEWAQQFIKNNTIIVKIGVTEDTARTYEVDLLIDQTDIDSSGKGWMVTAGGFIGDNSFLVDKSLCRSYTGNSYLAVMNCVQKDCPFVKHVEANPGKINEKPMNWIQSYETTSQFLIKTLLHMDSQPSFPLVTFDKEGTFWLRDYETMLKEGYLWRFVPATVKDDEIAPDDAAKSIPYINNFNVDNYQTAYNLYSGYDRFSEIYKVKDGKPTYKLNKNSPIVAATKVSNTKGAGNRIQLNKIQSGNVHDTYMEAFVHNTNKLVALSSIQGVLQVPGLLLNVKPTDLVYVQTGKEATLESNLEGLYFIDTIVRVPNFINGVCLTYVYVTRDNWNNVEDAVAEKKDKAGKKKKKVNVTKKAMQDLANAVSRTRVALSVCSQVMDGTFIRGVLSFISATKYNLLRMFSVAGFIIDFNSQATLMQSLLGAGNNIMNILLGTILPGPIAYMLRDVLLDPSPSVRKLIDRYISAYVPYEIQGLISTLIDALFSVQESLNSIAKDNGISARRTPEVTVPISTEFNESESIVNEILTEFERNTVGIDLPLPVITLDESQELMPVEEIKDYVAEETIANLTDLGYTDDLSPEEIEEFKDALTGETEGGLSGSISGMSIINKMNVNAGNSFMYRYWGTYGASNEAMYAWTYNEETVYTKTLDLTEFTRLYNSDYSPYAGRNFLMYKNSDGKYTVVYQDEDNEIYEAEADEERNISSNALAQLTSYYITNGYKDKYRTIPCTKLISATNNRRLYFACPQKEKNLKFYINSKRVNLESFPIDLGYVDARGNKLLYNVYFTTTGYNSNSTMLEIRQG
jgi:hypothetical protein